MKWSRDSHMLVQVNKQNVLKKLRIQGSWILEGRRLLCQMKGYVEDYGIRVARMSSQKKAGLLL